MPQKTNLNTQPYYDDFSYATQYYKVLFKPGVSVQVRELNTMQSILQNQIEQFGDNIYSNGTIVSGCNFQTFDNYNYIKLRDLDTSGNPVNVGAYKTLGVRNETTGLRGVIIQAVTGFEASDPNLNTLYVNYTNSGFDGVNYFSTFDQGDVLTIFNPVYNGIEQVTINNGGVGFANTNQVIAIAALAVINTVGFTIGQYITNGRGANCQVTGIDSRTLANSGQVILNISPRNADLSNISSNSASWTFSKNDVITVVGSNTSAGQISSLVGAGFRAQIITTATGTISTLLILSKGINYSTIPYISVVSPNNASGLSTLQLAPQNYLAKVSVANVAQAVGVGYAFGVSRGVIFSKGFFLDVEPQVLIVDKYNTGPNYPTNVCIGFGVDEQIVDFTQDQSLNDPASTINNGAPGADRLKLTPNLVMTDPVSAAANVEFFTIGQWNQGHFVKQNQQTVYSIIGDTMAQRTYEQSGDYVIDEFLLTTQSPTDITKEGTKFNVMVDPGVAYLQGYRVPTYTNDVIENEKGLDTVVTNNYTVALAYGNYFIVDQVGGTWSFNLGETIYLYDTPKHFISNTDLIKNSNTVPQGILIGTADIRSMIPLEGTPGTPSSSYLLYVFNVQLSNGISLAQVSSIYANATSVGICDVVPSIISTGNTHGGQIFDTKHDRLLFPARVESLKNANNISYQYRTVNTTAKVSNAGIVTVVCPSGDIFPYGPGAILDPIELSDIYLVPTETDAVFVANGSGTLSVNSVSSRIVGTNTAFQSAFVPGDWIYVYNNVGYDVHQISSIVNNTIMTIEGNCTFINTTSNYVKVYPKNVPIPLTQEANVSANINGTGTTLTINLGGHFNDVGDDGFGDRNVTVAFNVLRTGVSSASKQPNRLRYVKIRLANNTGGNTGPWSLGVPDAFRLRGVYLGNSTVINTTSANYISNFGVDTGQNPDYYGLSQLTMNVPLVFTGDQYLLVQFDYFTVASPGLYTTVSYIGSNANTIAFMDSLSLDDLTSNNGVNSFEISSVFDSSGQEMPLIQGFDFRPFVSNTAAPTTNPSTAPVNPNNAVSFGATEKKFPLPDSLFVCNMESYLGRTDIVVLDTKSNITVYNGIPNATPSQRLQPAQPKGTMLLGSVHIPAYPNISMNPSASYAEIINTNVHNGIASSGLVKRATITVAINTGTLPYNQPQNYTMTDIGTLDRRLQAVEYYVSLSQLESNVASMSIPSSVDPSTNRFQFGYFVDDFTTQLFSNLNDPQYAATKEGSDIVPSKLLFDVNLQGTIGTITYKDILLVDQLNATYAVPSGPAGNVVGPVCVGAFDNVVAYVTKYRSWMDNPSPAVSLANVAVDSVTLQFIDVAQLEQLYSNNNTNFTALTQVKPNINSIFNAIITEYNREFNPIEPYPLEHFIGPDYNNIIKQALASIASGALTFFGGNIGGGVGGRGFGGGPSELNQGGLGGGDGLGQLPDVISTIWTMFPFLTALPVDLFFYNYNNPTRIDILQSNTGVPMTSTAATVNGVSISASNQPRKLTQLEITTLTGPDSNYFFDDQPNIYLTDPAQATVPGSLTGYFTGAGAISFNYNAQQTEFYSVITSTFLGPNRRWKWAMGYPVGGATVGCIPDVETWNYILFESGCYNSYYGAAGQWYPPGVGLKYNGDYSNPALYYTLSASVQPFDISSMWNGGNNAVSASGTPYTGQIYAVAGNFDYQYYGTVPFGHSVDISIPFT